MEESGQIGTPAISPPWAEGLLPIGKETLIVARNRLAKHVTAAKNANAN
jgi:hypothetical protein